MRITRVTRYHFNQLSTSRAFFLLGLAACLVAAAFAANHWLVPSGCTTSAGKSVPVTINWAMAERFGPRYDRNRDGRPDLPNSHEYVNPGRYEVRLTACVDAPAVALTGMSCVWTIGGADRATGPEPVIQLPQGTYTVGVTVQLADGRSGSARETIRVKDILIVVLGDSLATGEGNPEVFARWERAEKSARRCAEKGHLDPSTPPCWSNGGPAGDQPRVTPAGILPPADVLHAVAHRSTLAGPAQFATRLEREDPHTSVTFVCLAASGAGRRPILSQTVGSEVRPSARGHAPGPA